jgi:hypothetical protein
VLGRNCLKATRALDEAHVKGSIDQLDNAFRTPPTRDIRGTRTGSAEARCIGCPGQVIGRITTQGSQT